MDRGIPLSLMPKAGHTQLPTVTGIILCTTMMDINEIQP